MDNHVKAVLEAMRTPDVDMVNDANTALGEVYKKWHAEGKLGPASMVALLVVVMKRYIDTQLPSETLPVVISMAWGVAKSMKWEEKKDG